MFAQLTIDPVALLLTIVILFGIGAVLKALDIL